MPETLVTILTAHLLADFTLQTKWIVKHKRNIGVLLIHVAIVTTISCLLMGAFHWPILVAIFLMHFAIDAIKVYRMADSLVPFLIDQCAHLVVLVGLSWLFPDTATSGWWATALPNGLSQWYFASMSFLSGLILTVHAGGILVGKATSSLTEEIGDEGIEGLKNGGKYIGWLERFLVMLFLLINQPTGIGFLIAAKSILRFGEIKNAGERKVAEYIIIGTFLSFGWALLISVLTQHAIQYWLPPPTTQATTQPTTQTTIQTTTQPTPTTTPMIVFARNNPKRCSMLFLLTERIGRLWVAWS